MNNFEYAEGRTEAQILSLLSPQPGHTEVIAGGTDLVGLLRKMAVAPSRVVNILEVPSMSQIDQLPDGSLRIGAVVRLDELLEHPYLSDFAAIGQAIAGISSMQLQAQGTLGGEICQRPRCWYFRSGKGLLEGSREAAAGDHRLHAVFGNQGPAKFVGGSRIAPALIALGAYVRVIGPGAEDEKLIPLADFYRTPRQEHQRDNILQPNQIVSHVVVPPTDGIANATYEVRQGAGPDYPLAAAAASFVVQAGIVQDAQVVLGQVAPTPWISPQAAKTLIGRRVDEQVAAEAGAAAISTATPLPGNAYKVDLAKVAVKRAILLAAGLETGGF